MKVACIRKTDIVIEEAPKPNLKDFKSGAVIKTLGCGLCGSDIIKLKESESRQGLVLGHEIVGEIIEINSKTNFKTGDKIVSSHHIPCFKCVYCKNENYSMCEHFKKTNILPGGFSEYIYLSEEHLQNVAVKLPKNLDEIEASFYEPLGCCIRAIKRGGSKYKGKKVLVVGLGSIGLLMGQALKAYGSEVFGCDIIQERIDFAKKFKIKALHSSKTEKLDADIIFLTAGADATIDLAIKSIRAGGTIVVFASTPKNSGFPNNEIYYRELNILGSYSPAPNDLKEALKLLKNGDVKVKNISTIYDFCDIKKSFHDTIENKVLKAYIKIG